MTMTEIPSLGRSAAFGALAIALVAAAGTLGGVATFPNLAPWYAGLTKPYFNPPNSVFGPVWTALYALMAFALWRILRRPADTPGRGTAIGVFLAQLAFNVAWPFLFFAARSPLLGLIDIIPQLALIIAAIVAFWRIDRLAALCLCPLLAWVAFASALNFAIWRLN